MVMIGMIGIAMIVSMVPMKFIIMFITLCCFSTASKLGKRVGNKQGNRRLKEWWDSIPVIPVRVVDKPLDSPTCN
jgi:heme/copper-type cytochrome/quinol oxidase subunit 2